MIRIQKLKEPKVTSGKKLDQGATIKFKGMMIQNNTKTPVYVDFYERKKYPPKPAKK
jgi:hypothetical protein